MKNEKKKENRSIYIYTALIFAVALVLIILTAFSQPRVNKLGKRAEEFKPEATESVTTDEIAKYANMAASLDTENKELNSEISEKNKQIQIYEFLLTANAQVSDGQFVEAEEMLTQIDATTLTENQTILYNEITEKINEGNHHPKILDIHPDKKKAMSIRNDVEAVLDFWKAEGYISKHEPYKKGKTFAGYTIAL